MFSQRFLLADVPTAPMNIKYFLLLSLHLHVFFFSFSEQLKLYFCSLPASSAPSDCWIFADGIILSPPASFKAWASPHSSVLHRTFLHMCSGWHSFFLCYCKMMMKPYRGWWCQGCKGGKQEGEQHSGLNDFLAVQRDVKDRLMWDGVASKLMSYILDGVKKRKKRGRGD